MTLLFLSLLVLSVSLCVVNFIKGRNTPVPPEPPSGVATEFAYKGEEPNKVIKFRAIRAIRDIMAIKTTSFA